MSRWSQFRYSVALLSLLPAFYTHAVPIKLALVTGGFASSADSTGMDTIQSKLSSEFGSAISSKVFGHSQQSAAIDFLNESPSSSLRGIIGHSYGGDSALELAKNFGNPLDFVITIDTVGSFDEKLPSNVAKGLNYYQIYKLSDGGSPFLDGERNVRGATNFNVEDLLSDDSITHTSIDDDGRVHDLILDEFKDILDAKIAATSFTGELNGVFKDPVLSGIHIDIDGNREFLNNSATAVYHGFGTDAINWGVRSQPAPGVDPFSSLRFEGADILEKKFDQKVKLGRITYSNGTSTTGTGIFGGLLEITANLAEGPPVDPFRIQFTIRSTSNTGISKERDADRLTLDWPNFDALNIHEGESASADIYGRIRGDPYFELTDFVLVTPKTGFLSSISEPSVLWIVLIGAMGLIIVRRGNPLPRLAFP